MMPILFDSLSAGNQASAISEKQDKTNKHKNNQYARIVVYTCNLNTEEAETGGVKV